MRPRLTLTLFFLNVLLFGGLYLAQREASRADALRHNVDLVFGPLTSDLDSLSLAGPGIAEPWSLQRVDGAWRLVDPVSWPANPFAVDRLLSAVQFLEVQARFRQAEIEETGRSLADYGLAEPAVTLTVGRGNQQETLHLGGTTEVGERLYARREGGDRVLVVSRELLESLAIGLPGLRSEAVFSMPAFAIENVSIQQPGTTEPALRLARTNDSWRMESPVEAEADPDEVQTRLVGLTRLTVDDFREMSPAEAGLEPGAYRIALDGDGARQTLIVGRSFTQENGRVLRYARRADSPAVILIPELELLEVLEDAETALRSRDLVPFPITSVERIAISSPTENLTLQAIESGEWRVLANGRGDDLSVPAAEPSVIETILLLIDELRVVSFVTDEPTPTALEEYGLTQPQRTLRLDTGEQSITFQFGKRDFARQEVFLQRAGENFVYGVRPEILGYLRFNYLFYKDRLLAETPPSASVVQLTVTDLTSGEVVFSRSQRSNADATNPFLTDEDEPFQREAILALYNFARVPRVRGYLADDYAEEYVSGSIRLPWRWRLDVVFELPGGQSSRAERVAYTFSERLGGTTQIGGSPDHEVMFEVPQTVVDALFVIADRPARRLPEAPDPVYREETAETAPEIATDPTNSSPPATDEASPPAR